MFSKLLIVALAAVGANANLLTNKARGKAVACDDPSGDCGEGKDCHPKYVQVLLENMVHCLRAALDACAPSWDHLCGGALSFHPGASLYPPSIS